MVPVHDLYKPGDGWDISFIDTSKVLSKESALKSPDPVYSGVTAVQLGLKSNRFYFQTIRFNRSSRDAIIEQSEMAVLHVVAYKKNGRIFAYMLSGEVRSLVKGEELACSFGTELLVYDPDGTGTFSHLILFFSGPLYVPEWVRSDLGTKRSESGVPAAGKQ
jgi:hypothetical protein